MKDSARWSAMQQELADYVKLITAEGIDPVRPGERSYNRRMGEFDAKQREFWAAITRLEQRQTAQVLLDYWAEHDRWPTVVTTRVETEVVQDGGSFAVNATVTARVGFEDYNRDLDTVRQVPADLDPELVRKALLEAT